MAECFSATGRTKGELYGAQANVPDDHRSACRPEKLLPRHQALVVPRHAGATDDGAYVVDLAGDGTAELAFKRRAAAALAAHAAEIRSHIVRRNALELLLRLQRKARPVGRIRAARAAALAVEILMGHTFSLHLCTSKFPTAQLMFLSPQSTKV